MNNTNTINSIMAGIIVGLTISILFVGLTDNMIAYADKSNNDDGINRMKKQQEIEAKENEIEEAIENASDKTVKESVKEAKILGDSEHD